MAQKVYFRIRRIRKNRKKIVYFPRHKQLLFSPAMAMGLKYAGLILITMTLMAVVYLRQQTGQWFKASVLDMPQPFNGTVLPVSKVPNWSKWQGNNTTTKYSEISASDLIDLPAYNLTKMQFPNDQLIWGNAEHDVIRNMKITYSVVYMGNYELDHQENSGSHLGVDIKIPQGTPVHAVANGKVVKTSTQSSGFGHHICIEHFDVPDPENPGSLTNLYSCYVHLDEVKVSEGQNVLKGEAIGTSGNTGTSTTPHLHFQMDRESAPWHPYWPFTTAESQAAGYSFFEAVNHGLGMDNARANTVNPIKYVTTYLGAYSVATSNPGGTDNPAGNGDNGTGDQSQTVVDGEQNATQDSADTEIEVVDNPLSSDKTDTSLFTFKMAGESVSLLNNGVTITVTDESNQVSKMSDSDVVRAEITGVGQLTKKEFTKNDFKSHSIKLIVNSSETGTANVMIGKSAHQVTYVEQAQAVSSFRIETDGKYQRNIPETVYVVALDASGNPTATVNFTGAVTLTAKEGQATFSPGTITTGNFKNGKAEIKILVPSEENLIIRAQQGALVGESERMTAEELQLFTDVSRINPHYEAIKWMKEQGIISGYSDGTFKPDNTVNRVEALKMLMLAFNVPAGPAGELPFADTENAAWYSATLATALNKGIVSGYDDGTFKPAQTVNKAEYLKILFKTNNMELNDSLTSDPYSDVPMGAWYAPFAYMANRKNLIDVTSNTLNPGGGMTRGEVAETVYRLKYIMDNNLVTYSK
ncbi:S-layer homology domain-containing protein [Candidatus Peregrinibacteria bacterium]|nr:S-layer homology domain-containing protein [Candidatus Peregrinibacteria bacterium]